MLLFYLLYEQQITEYLLFLLFCQILQLVIPKVQLQLCELLCMFLFVNVMDELSRQLFFSVFFFNL